MVWYKPFSAFWANMSHLFMLWILIESHAPDSNQSESTCQYLRPWEENRDAVLSNFAGFRSKSQTSVWLQHIIVCLLSILNPSVLDAEREVARQCCQLLLESFGNERSTLGGHSTLASWMWLFSCSLQNCCQWSPFVLDGLVSGWFWGC